MVPWLPIPRTRAGFFGKNWLRPIAECPECELAGLVAQHPDLLAASGEEFGVPASRRFPTIAEGLEGAGCRAVVVALPGMVHREAILAALAAGKHVLTEKPLAVTLAEARDIILAARRAAGATVMVDQNYRWRPQNQALRRAVREGMVGALGAVRSEFRQPITRTTTDAWREQMPHPYLLDMAVHHFDLLRACTGLECVENWWLVVSGRPGPGTRKSPAWTCCSPSSRGSGRAIRAAWSLGASPRPRMASSLWWESGGRCG